MKALFLAGGKGTRLRPLTDHLPKPMVPVMGRPLLERSIEELQDCDVNEVVFSTCYRADDIQKYFSLNREQGPRIQYVCEDMPLGTGGAIKNCADYFDDTFLIFNSDIVSNLDLKDLIRFHKAKHADVTIAATRVPNPSSYGVIEYDEFGFATSFTEKPKPGEEKSDYINAGIYVFEPKILDLIPSKRVVSIEKEIFPALLKNGYKIAVYRGGSYWIDIGTPEKYVRVHADIFSGLCRVPENNFMTNHVFAGGKAEIHGTAKIIGPVWFGENVRIGANVTIGPNVVVGSGFQSGRGCVVSNSILWNDVSIGSGVSIDKSVITAGCHIGSGIQCANTIYSQESKRHLVI
ncbi:MAG: NDP-sugar synthase [Oscillospiraceae bacterium]|jgi:mannose-1-phosphate guanylyltransferase|nr:NDP-sugar synthase [Oscillospiraceae bacterium]